MPQPSQQWSLWLPKYLFQSLQLVAECHLASSLHEQRDFKQQLESLTSKTQTQPRLLPSSVQAGLLCSTHSNPSIHSKESDIAVV